MRRFLPFILVGAIYFLGIPVCGAYEDELSAYQAHLQAVNQELDRIEASGNQTPVAQAVGNNQAATPNSKMYKHNDFEFGSEMYWARYQQHKVERQKGFMSGYNTRYTFRTSPNSSIINMYRVEGQLAGGKFKYQTDDGVVHFDGIKDKTYEVRGLVGKDFYPRSYLRATPYTGLGYRYLEDNPEGLSDTVGQYTYVGYKTYTHYGYVPFGADILYQTNPAYSVDSSFEYDYLARGWEVSKLGVLDLGYSTTDNGQKKGFGLRASLRLNLYFKYVDAYAEGFVRYWNIEQSENIPDPTNSANPPLNIPKNSTQEYGLRLGVQI